MSQLIIIGINDFVKLLESQRDTPRDTGNFIHPTLFYETEDSLLLYYIVDAWMYYSEYDKVNTPLISREGREMSLEDIKLEFLEKGIQLLEPLQTGRMEVIVR